MANFDIFKPEVSKVVKGMEGKALFLYGSNGVGKTLNATKAPKPYVICFENGLGAISGVPHARMKKWTDFLSIVKQFTSPTTREQAKKMYKTIVVDGADGLGHLCDPYVASLYGAESVRSGNSGYGLWTEFADELRKPIKALCSSGFTIIFLGHEAERELPCATPNKDGEYKCRKLYPKGEKRAIDVIIDECDIVGYIQAQPATVLGEEILSSIYFANNNAFIAKTRYTMLPRMIEEWNYDKLEKAIVAAIEAEEKISGHKAISAKEFVEKNEAEEKEETQQVPVEELIQHIGLMLQAMGTKNGSLDEFNEIKKANNIPADFKCNTATEKERDILEVLESTLVEKGYTWNK